MKEVFRYFLRLGFSGFGGPLALIAIMHRELVQERKWISEEEFRQVFPLIKSMPGPVATQLAIYIGYRRAGRWAGLLAAIGTILPAFFMMILFAEFHDNMAAIPWIQSMMNGLQAAAFALIAGALKPLLSPFFSKEIFWVLILIAFALFLFSVPEPVVVLGFGALAIAWNFRGRFLAGVAALPMVAEVSTWSISSELFWTCLKAGALVFGSGLAIVPFLEADFVERFHWLTHKEFMEAVAFGQMTPGPFVITVTFIGYKVLGFWGAVLATLGIFLPATFHMLTWFPSAVGWLQKQKWIADFTLFVAASVGAAIIFSLVKLSTALAFEQVLMAILFYLVSYQYKVSSIKILGMGALLGLIV